MGLQDCMAIGLYGWAPRLLAAVGVFGRTPVPRRRACTRRVSCVQMLLMLAMCQPFSAPSRGSLTAPTRCRRCAARLRQTTHHGRRRNRHRCSCRNQVSRRRSSRAVRSVRPITRVRLLERSSTRRSTARSASSRTKTCLTLTASLSTIDTHATRGSSQIGPLASLRT